jgi:hypothetical protein
MSNALTRYESTDDTGMNLAQLGQAIVKSGYFADAKDASQAIIKVLAGKELGLGPIASMTGIYIVKGRVTMSANLIAAQIKRSGRYTYQVLSMTDEKVEIVFSEVRGTTASEIGRSAFTKQDAITAGLWQSSDPWKKTPRNMLFARAMSNGAKWFCPDIFVGPVYTPDELEGPVQEASYQPVDIVTGEVINPTPLSKREKLLARIVDVDQEAKSLGLKVEPAHPLDQLGDDELLDYGVDLRRSIDIELSLRAKAKPVAA